MAGSTMHLKLTTMEDTNTIHDQKTENNKNWDTVDSEFQNLRNLINSSSDIYVGQTAPPTPNNYKIWIDPTTDYDTSTVGSIIASSQEQPSDSSGAILWLETDGNE